MEKKKRHLKRKRRVRAKVFGTSECPRLTVFRSSQHIYAQIVDDNEGKTLLSYSDKNLVESKTKKSKIDTAFLVGEGIAKKGVAKKISKVVFDRAGYRYHGRVKALSEGARKGGLKF